MAPMGNVLNKRFRSICLKREFVYYTVTINAVYNGIMHIPVPEDM